MGGSLFVHARIAGVAACVLATAVQAAESQRWQAVYANDVKVGQVQISRSVTDAGVVETERLEMNV